MQKRNVFVIVLAILFVVVAFFLYRYFYSPQFSPDHELRITRSFEMQDDGMTKVTLNVYQNPSTYSLVVDENSPVDIVEDQFLFEDVAATKGFVKVVSPKSLEIVLLSEFSDGRFSYFIKKETREDFSGIYESSDGTTGAIENEKG